jgi:hypothetical protein
MLVQMVAHEPEQCPLAVQLGLGAAVNAPLAAALMGKPAGVAIAPSIAMNLPADGAGAAPQSSGDGSDALLLL